LVLPAFRVLTDPVDESDNVIPSLVVKVPWAKSSDQAVAMLAKTKTATRSDNTGL
jgi:hypothetical protein